MPSKTARQRRFAGAELARKRAGKPTETRMSETQLADFAKKPPTSGGKTTTRNRSRKTKR
jgi:hypothetical protein